MMQLCFFFLLFISVFTHTAEINKYFITMKQHVENCPIDCTSSECIPNHKIVPNDSKAIYKGVYCTYHCLSEFNGQQYGLDQGFRFFVNYYGEVLICKKNATTKKELLLFKRYTGFESQYNRGLDFQLKEILYLKKTNELETLSVPDFRFAQSIDRDDRSDYMLQKKLCYCKPPCLQGEIDYDRSPVNMDINYLCCFKNATPLEIVNRIYNMMSAIKPRITYLYSFFDTTGAEKYYTNDKKYFFSLVDITHLTTAFNHWQKKLSENDQKDPKLHFATADYRHFLVDHKFSITDLYTDIDLFSNGGKRIAMVCEQEEHINNSVSSKIEKSTMLMHIPRRHERRDCAEDSAEEDWFCIKLYTIDQIKKNHEALAKGTIGEWFEKLPLNCYHAQIITGPEQEIRNYFAVALKRVALKHSCLAKNDAATKNGCTVYNNPFGQFVVMREGKATVLKASLTCEHRSSERYYAVHSNEDVQDNVKMLERAKQCAQMWKKTSDGRFLYCWEEKPQGTCTQVYPYGVECGWSNKWAAETHYYGFCSLYEAQDKEDINFRGAGLESYGRYRVWIMPTHVHVCNRTETLEDGLCKTVYSETDVSYFESKSSSDLPFYVAYTDWPYEVTQVQNDVLVFEHEQSDFILTLEIPDIKQKYYFANKNRIRFNLAQVFFDNKLSDATDPQCCKVVPLLRMHYAYKDEEKRKQFDTKKQNYNEQKEKDSAADKLEIDLGAPASSTVVKRQDTTDLDAQNNLQLPPLEPQIKFNGQDDSQLSQQSYYRKIASRFVTVLQNNTLKIFRVFTRSALLVGVMWYLYKYRIPGLNAPNPNKTAQVSYPI